MWRPRSSPHPVPALFRSSCPVGWRGTADAILAPPRLNLGSGSLSEVGKIIDSVGGGEWHGAGEKRCLNFGTFFKIKMATQNKVLWAPEHSDLRQTRSAHSLCITSHRRRVGKNKRPATRFYRFTFSIPILSDPPFAGLAIRRGNFPFRKPRITERRRRKRSAPILTGCERERKRLRRATADIYILTVFLGHKVRV